MAFSPRYPCMALAGACAVLFNACAGMQRVPHATQLAETAPVSFQYPNAPRGDVIDNYHGASVADPYRWFENMDSTATQGWVTAQNALSQPFLESLPQRAWLGNRLKQLWTYERFGVPERQGGR